MHRAASPHRRVPSSRDAQDGCKPVNGRFEARVVPPGVGHCLNIPGVL